MCLAIPGRLLTIIEPDSDREDASLYRRGKVQFGGITKEISLAYVPEAQVGDYLIVHVGFAISILDEDAAQQTLQDLQQLEAISS